MGKKCSWTQENKRITYSIEDYFANQKILIKRRSMALYADVPQGSILGLFFSVKYIL